VAAGYSSKQIAAKMKISARTVEFYRSVVMMKLGFKSMAEMMKFAVKAGLAD
jgi:DNA-binding NarL/FixJ family response regulator